MLNAFFALVRRGAKNLACDGWTLDCLRMCDLAHREVLVCYGDPSANGRYGSALYEMLLFLNYGCLRSTESTLLTRTSTVRVRLPPLAEAHVRVLPRSSWSRPLGDIVRPCTKAMRLVSPVVRSRCPPVLLVHLFIHSLNLLYCLTVVALTSRCSFT